MGPTSASITGRTLANYPSEPAALQEYHTNSTCITLEWDEPDTPNGQIIQYKVKYNI